MISDLWRAAHVGSQPCPALLLNSCPMTTQVNTGNLLLYYSRINKMMVIKHSSIEKECKVMYSWIIKKIVKSLE